MAPQSQEFYAYQERGRATLQNRMHYRLLWLCTVLGGLGKLYWLMLFMHRLTSSIALVTSRNLHETDIFNTRNIQRQQYHVSSLPQTPARKILLKKATDYIVEKNIHDLLELCGGVPLLLEIAGSQLAISSRNTINIVLELLRDGEKVEEEDISDRMVDFVYHRLLPPVKEAFLDITSFFHSWPSKKVVYIVGEEEYRALEDASFIKTSQMGTVIVHDIVRARGEKMSEQNRMISETLLKCLKDEEKLKI